MRRVRRGSCLAEALVADLENLINEIPDPKRHAGNFEPTEALKTVPLNPSGSDDKMLMVSSELDPK